MSENATIRTVDHGAPTQAADEARRLIQRKQEIERLMRGRVANYTEKAPK